MLQLQLHSPTGTLSFDYNDSGNTIVSFTPTVAGDYILSYTITAGSDESAVDSVTVTAQANTLSNWYTTYQSLVMPVL